MTIKEVSEKYDISQDTLRYYERVGMIPKVNRTAGGIRYCRKWWKTIVWCIQHIYPENL